MKEVNSMKIKPTNNFLYAIFDDGKSVAVAFTATRYNIAGQRIVHPQLDGVLKHTGMFRDLIYNDHLYIAVVYENTLTEEELIAALNTKPVQHSDVALVAAAGIVPMF